MIPPVLDVRGLGISFGGLKAVDDVSFSVERHRITTIIGPNGAGKSTLFNLISGALTPRNGKVMIDGVENDTRFCRAEKSRGSLPLVPDH